MLRRTLSLGSAIAGVVLLTACSQSPNTMLSPTAATGDTSANPDGSTLKVSAPSPVGPENGSRIDSVRPTVTFANAAARFTSVALNYRVQVFNGSGVSLGDSVVAQSASGQTSLTGDSDLEFDTEYQWRVRAEYQGEAGPWSPVWTFKTVQRPAIGASVGTVGTPRDIGFGEAYAIIYAIYTTGRWDITGRSNREQLNLFLETAVAALHYGHGKWNPRGPDTGWCIKNGGPGRPQSDDVIARCDSRDAWDLVGGIGGNNPVWAPTYLGRLDNSQQIYAPRQSTLALLP